MDLEETKKIIQNKIEAGEMTREVRSQIKSYIDQKQNLREGFKETFKPLIETQEAVKASIDKEQNAMIEQLQKNQEALTEGLNKNRLAITSGFDKMDEVKRWDLSQLPGFEAIEEPKIEESEKETENILEEPGYWISNNDLKLLLGGDESNFTEDGEELIKIKKDFWDEIMSQDKLNLDKYKTKVVTVDPSKTVVKVVERDYGKKPKKVVTFDDTDLDIGLINQNSAQILKELKLPLPSKLKNSKLEDIKTYQLAADSYLETYKNLLPNTRAIKYVEEGVNKAVKLRKGANPETLKRIDYYNTIGQYISNLKGVVDYAKKKKQDKASSTSTIPINLLTDSNYLLDLSLLEIMV